MTNPIPFARRRLVDEVIDHLRTEISSGRLTVGSRLPAEARLTEQLGVSRTTLREAIVVLSHDGLVDVRQGDGTYVTEGVAAADPLGNRSVAELLELKRALQLELTRLASVRRTEQEATELRAHASKLAAAVESQTGDAIRGGAANLESAIGAAAHSALAAELAQQTSRAIETAAKTEYERGSSWSTAFGHLVQSARGIVDRDAESADRCARLWLAAQASLLQPTKPPAEYGVPESRRGPRASHAKRDTGQLDAR